MSLIYTALEKAQKNRNQTSLSNSVIAFDTAKNKSKRNTLIIFLCVTTTLLMLSFHFYLSPINGQHLQTIVKNNINNQNPLTLNGIISDPEGNMAIINNHTYVSGDEINKMKIVAVKEKEILLQKNNQIIKMQLSV